MNNKITWKSCIKAFLILLNFSGLLYFYNYYNNYNNENILTVVINSEMFNGGLDSIERSFIKLALNKTNVKYRIIYKPFVQLMHYVKNRNNTIGMGLIGSSNIRKKIFQISIPYCYSVVGFMYDENNYYQKQTVVIGAQGKTTLLNLLNEKSKFIKQSLNIKKYEILLSDNISTLMENLEKQKIDFIICNESMCAKNAKFVPLIVNKKVYKENIVIIFNNVDKSIIDSINSSIHQELG